MHEIYHNIYALYQSEARPKHNLYEVKFHIILYNNWNTCFLDNFLLWQPFLLQIRVIILAIKFNFWDLGEQSHGFHAIVHYVMHTLIQTF